MESKKQAAKRPRPPLPSEGSFSKLSTVRMDLPFLDNNFANSSYRPKLIKFLPNCLPMRNSALM